MSPSPTSETSAVKCGSSKNTNRASSAEHAPLPSDISSSEDTEPDISFSVLNNLCDYINVALLTLAGHSKVQI